MAEFTGFSKAGMALLRALPTYDKERFAAERAGYRAELAEPLKAFVAALGPPLASAISPGLRWEARTNGSISPINNDLRFDPDASPYRDHLLIRFWEGPDKRTAPTLWVRIDPGHLGFAAGVVPAEVAAWRAVVDSPAGAAIADAIRVLATDVSADVVGQGLKRVPAPYGAEHPRADLLRHKWLQVRWPSKVRPTSSALVDECVAELARAGDLHRRLVAAFG